MTLIANNLSCHRQQRKLFAELSFELQAGEILLVEGDNGSGKSSLLRLLVGLSTPHAGSVLWDGKPIQTVRDEYVAELHYVGHTNGIKLGLTVAENLQLATQLSSRKMSKTFIRDPWWECSIPSDASVTDKWIPAFAGMTAFQDTLAKHLSAGQQRKIALAKLFLLPKTLWVLDEPLTALDTHTQQLLVAKIEEHVQQGSMCIMTSHHAVRFQTVTPKIMRLSS